MSVLGLSRELRKIVKYMYVHNTQKGREGGKEGGREGGREREREDHTHTFQMRD